MLARERREHIKIYLVSNMDRKFDVFAVLYYGNGKMMPGQGTVKLQGSDGHGTGTMWRRKTIVIAIV